jgi:hypothetical protein
MQGFDDSFYSHRGIYFRILGSMGYFLISIKKFQDFLTNLAIHYIVLVSLIYFSIFLTFLIERSMCKGYRINFFIPPHEFLGYPSANHPSFIQSMKINMHSWHPKTYQTYIICITPNTYYYSFDEINI